MSEPRQGVEQFSKALGKLREFAAMPIVNDRDRAGVIQSFELSRYLPSFTAAYTKLSEQAI